MKRMRKGVFTISLDFELYWGVRDHRSLRDYGENIKAVHQVTPALLDLFTKYNVHCSWATVGFLFHRHQAELSGALPQVRPAYEKKEYDPYAYLQNNPLEEIYHFAPELIKRISETPGQEIGTHTYSHFYTLEKGAGTDAFKEDIGKAISVAAGKGYQLESIVFPRNQYGQEHIRICRESGIKVYRGNENASAYKPVSREEERASRRAIRLLDAYINLTGHHCHPWPESGAIINVPASRFLRPYHPKLKMADGLKRRRIIKGMRYAAATGKIFQLWWHPHNFGKFMEENLRFLESVLIEYSHLNQEDRMESLTLKEIYERTITGSNQP